MRRKVCGTAIAIIGLGVCWCAIGVASEGRPVALLVGVLGVVLFVAGWHVLIAVAEREYGGKG